MTRRSLALAVALLALGTLAAASTLRASADPTPAPSRAYLHGHNVPSSGLALEGYCPVAYFAVNKPVRGKPEYSADHDGITYRFVSAEARAAFLKEPKKYLPAFGGWCAFGMAVEDKFPVDPTLFKIVDGQLLVFLRNSNVDALKLWNQKDQRKLMADAKAHWKKVQGK